MIVMSVERLRRDERNLPLGILQRSRR